MIVHNPLFRTDMPDPDVIRVGEYYYMVSTTMFYMPAAPILKSKDLVNWEIVSYICTEIADNEIYRLEHKKQAYGKGQWATSLMQYKGKFYACFVCHDLYKTFLFSTDDIEKSDWDCVELKDVYHDMSFLCWEDHVYLVYGNGQIRIVELNETLTGIVEGSDRLLFEAPKEGMRLYCEGCRAYVRNGWIYLLFIDWPADTEEEQGKRREVCYRSRTLMGPYEWQTILYDDMWIPGCGVAQGPIISDENDNWYAMMFQDSGGLGRVPFLMPMKWENDWPVLGIGGKVPESFELPFEETAAAPLIQSDSFAHEENKLGLTWQWNHNPDKSAWSFTERPGFLRLHNRTKADNLTYARNTLTQRTGAPYSCFTVQLDSSGLQDGDFAGLCAFQEKYGQIGVKQKNGQRFIVYQHRDGERAPMEVAWPDGLERLEKWYTLKEHTVELNQENVWLRIVFRFDSWKSGAETAEFWYSTDGENYVQLGEALDLFSSLSVFVGVRVGIFSYNNETADGGYADFCDFKAEFEQ